MFHRQEIAVNKATGVPIPGVIVRLYDADSNPVSLYSDTNGTPIITVSGIANAAVADTAGNYSYYVNDGLYTERLYIGDAEFFAIPDLVCQGLVTTIQTPTFADASSIATSVDTNLVIASGTSAVGDSGTGRTFAYDAAVDAAYVAANPDTSFLDGIGRGFKEVPGSSAAGLSAALASTATGKGGAMVKLPDGTTVTDKIALFKVNSTVPFVSAAGTRTVQAPRITFGNGPDTGFDSLITSNVATVGTSLFRDEFQDMSGFNSTGGAHASFDAFCDFNGVGDHNHHRGFQARGKISITGTGSGTAGLPLLSEWTGHFVQPIFDGSWQIGQMAGLWIRDAQVDSGTPSIVTAYGIKIDHLTQGSGTIYAIYVENDVFINADLQLNTTNIKGVSEYKGVAGNFTGGYTSFDAGGGLLCTGNATASGYASIRAYSNGSGGVRGLAINETGGQVLIGIGTPVTGKSLEIGGSASVTAGYFYNASQVVGARDTGWTPMTGTGSKGALAAAAAGTASASYVQAELQGALNRIAALEARLKSYDAALVAHGLIGA